MNANEVIAHLATKRLKKTVHPNDHVNYGQSSNDVIPTAIHVAAALLVHADLKPALKLLATTIEKRARQLKRSEEHTSELQSLMRISYAVFCLKKQNNND